MAKRWTEEEEKFLKDNYKTMSYQEIGLVLNRNIPQIKEKRRYLGLCVKSMRFTKKEYDFISNNYPQLSIKTIANRLKIKERKVQGIISRIKINTKKPFFKHDYLSISAIHQILNVPISFLKSLIECKFIRISLFKTQKRTNFCLVHIDEFEKIKDFLNNYISTKEFANITFFQSQTILNRVKTKKIKNFLKVGSKYFINKNEIEIQRSL